jgi:hypothetical protein
LRNRLGTKSNCDNCDNILPICILREEVLEIGRLVGQTIQRKKFRQHKVIVAINKLNNNQKQDGTG